MGRVSAGVGRLSTQLRRRPPYLPFVLLLVVAVLARIATSAMWFPMVMDSVDSPRFARIDPTGLFSDYYMPAGYPLFLKVLHGVSDQVWFSIAIQHIVGLGAGIVVYLAVRRLGLSPLVSTLAAAIPLLAGDALFLEQIFMADALMFAFCVFALGAAVRGLVPRVDWRWLLASGALGMAAALCRNVGGVALIAVGVCVLACAGGGARRRLVTVVVVAAGAAAVFGAYAASYAVSDGEYLGLSDMSGWNLYTRVAPFADCSKFTPPKGTRVVCERRPSSARPGPLGYIWDENSISRRQIKPFGPKTSPRLGRFARRAIVHQPAEYVAAVVTDLGRYVEPSIGKPNRPFSGQSRDLVSFGFRDPPTEALVTRALSRRYDGTEVRARGTRALATYQNVIRVDRLWLLLALVALVAGLISARGPARLGCALFGLTGLGLYVLPTLTLSYDFRYGIPAGLLVGVAGVIGGVGVLQARRANHVAEPAIAPDPGPEAAGASS